MQPEKILFIDRDGTLIVEPEDQQIDSLEKFQLLPGVIPALLQLRQAGFKLVMVSNQDGLGTPAFPLEQFNLPQQWLLNIFQTQGILFDDIHICPHFPSDNCNCRKPKLGLLMPYLIEQKIDRYQSYVIGDRDTDLELANNLGIKGLLINSKDPLAWRKITYEILYSKRSAKIVRNTKETQIDLTVNLDHPNIIIIDTGIGFFDHMLEQLAKHGNFSLSIQVKGDLQVDDHHTIEDVALALGTGIKQALGDKRGISRYGFLLPMDEAQAKIALDLSGRPYFKFVGQFNREKVGETATELIPHFFRSLSDSLGAALHIEINGENAHHMIEAIFKGMGKTLAQAMLRSGSELPSTKGVL